MPDEPPKLPPEEMPPQLPVVRPPVPGWMWLLFAFGLVPVGMLIGAATTRGNDFGGAGMVGGIVGLFCGLPLITGLALASRFFSDTGGRIVMGIVFSVIVVVGVGAVVFAGCMCLFSGNNVYR